jgi:phage shock protein A
MGILSRMSTILRSNINALLDQAEDPEKMLDQIIRDMSDEIREARNQVAIMIAQEKELQSDAQENRSLATQWEQKAELAVKSSRDDLAREALRRKTDYDKNADTYETQWKSQQDMVSKLKEQLQALESKYNSTVANRDVLLARHRRAEAQKQVATTMAQISITDHTSELGRMEQRIKSEEAQAEALSEVQASSIDAQFEKLGGDNEVEDQLAALKAKVEGKALPEPKA